MRDLPKKLCTRPRQRTGRATTIGKFKRPIALGLTGVNCAKCSAEARLNMRFLVAIIFGPREEKNDAHYHKNEQRHVEWRSKTLKLQPKSRRRASTRRQESFDLRPRSRLVFLSASHRLVSPLAYT